MTSSPSPPRYLLALVLLIGAGGAAAITIPTRPVGDFMLAGGLIALFTPLKALMLRWTDGARPYQSAFAASLFSVLLGLGFSTTLNLPMLLVRSTITTALSEALMLFAMRAAEGPLRLLLIATYMSVVVHLLLGGFVLFHRAAMIGGSMIGVGVLVMWLPLFLPRLPPRRGTGSP